MSDKDPISALADFAVSVARDEIMGTTQDTTSHNEMRQSRITEANDYLSKKRAELERMSGQVARALAVIGETTNGEEG